MGGLFISGQFGDSLTRFLIVLVSVAVPLFTGGIFMACVVQELSMDRKACNPSISGIRRSIMITP